MDGMGDMEMVKKISEHEVEKICESHFVKVFLYGSTDVMTVAKIGLTSLMHSKIYISFAGEGVAKSNRSMRIAFKRQSADDIFNEFDEVEALYWYKVALGEYKSGETHCVRDVVIKSRNYRNGANT